MTVTSVGAPKWLVICVYTDDFTNQEDAFPVKAALKDHCGITEPINYKPDIYTHLNVYSHNKKREHRVSHCLYQW